MKKWRVPPPSTGCRDASLKKEDLSQFGPGDQLQEWLEDRQTMSMLTENIGSRQNRDVYFLIDGSKTRSNSDVPFKDWHRQHTSTFSGMDELTVLRREDGLLEFLDPYNSMVIKLVKKTHSEFVAV